MAIDFTPWIDGTTQYKAAQMNAPLTEIKDSGNAADEALQTAIDGKADTDHTHVVADITDFPDIGTGDVIGPATNTDGWTPDWNGTNSKTLGAGYQVTTVAKTLLDDTTIAAMVTTLGLDKVPIIVSWPGKPDDAAVISVWPPACAIPANLAGATYHGVVDPATQAVVSLSKNGAAAFGTLTVAAGSTDVVTLSSSETSFNGTTDRLDITFPEQDADWSGVSFKIMGVRS